jgi:hypothetical protein
MSVPTDLDALVARLHADREQLTVTATLDLTPGSTGQPPALRTFQQAARAATEGMDKRVAAAVEAEIMDLQAIADDASQRGVLGLIYVAHPDHDPATPRAESGEFMVVELAAPARSSLHAGTGARIFEVARAKYLERPVAHVTTDLHTMNVTRLAWGAEEANEEVDWPAHYLTKRGQRTAQSGRGGGGQSDERGGGHSYVRQQRQVNEQRNLFANEAAEHLAKFVQPDDLLVIEGVDEARSQLLGRVPQQMAERAVQLGAANPTEDERDRFARLRLMAEESRMREAAQRVDDWFAGNSPNTLSSVSAIHQAATEGRVATVIVHQDAEDHLGYADDTRLRPSPVDGDAIEAALMAAIGQGAAVYFTDDPRVLEQQGGMIGIARY